MNKKNYYQVAQHVWGKKLGFVNIYMIAHSQGEKREWVLIDAGLKGSAPKIREMADALFGPGSKPSAIVLTHGHADHIGALEELLGIWNVPVFAHSLELPYLTGRSAYPPGDPTVGGGLMSLFMGFSKQQPIGLGTRVLPLDDGDKVPFLPDWRVVHTPGHSPGHISLYRELNATLIAGDAFVSTKNESLFSAFSFKHQLGGPPRYFTSDWEAARNSVRKLAALQPRVAATGHGWPVTGKELRLELNELAGNFNSLAVPSHGRYVGDPAITGEEGVIYAPPFKTHAKFTAGIFLGAVLTGALAAHLTRRCF